MAIYGYRIIRDGANAILAVDTRSVSKGRGLLLGALSAAAGVFFLLIAVTSHHDRVLGTVIFLISVLCLAGCLYGVRTVVVRTIVFTPDALLVEGDYGRRFFELAPIEGVFASHETLKMKYGSETVTILRRLPDADRVKSRIDGLLREFKPALAKRGVAV